MPAFKKVNIYTSNEFHDWQRANLPRNFVLQDIDTWALVWADSSKDVEPFAIVELKRSFIEPNAWRPFKADMPNYVALKKLADKAGLPLWIIYFKKSSTIKRIPNNSHNSTADTVEHVLIASGNADISEVRESHSPNE
ncbi:hypothetical protein ES703_14948 [subsurface metagenome]